MALESATFIDDLVTTNPPGSDKKTQGDDHLRLIKSVLRTCFPRAAKAFRFPTSVAKSADYTVLSTDDNTTFTVDTTAAAVSLTLPSLVSGDAGWSIQVMKSNSGTNPVFLVPPSGTINGFTKVRRTAENLLTRIVWNGSIFVASRPNGGNVGEIRTFFGATLPNDCLWPDGTTFTAANFVELNTVLGGNTKPDLRGRGLFGKDNMGGSAANRITVAGGNVDGTVLGAAAGAQNHTLTTTECPTGLITFNAGSHAHTFNDSAQGNPTTSSRVVDNLGGGSFGGAGTATAKTLAINTASSGDSITDHGGNAAHSVLSPGLIVNFGIVAE